MSRRTTTVAVVIAAALVGTAAWAVWFAASAPDRHSDDDYLRAATQEVELLVTADADDPDRAQRILSRATGPFRDSFAQSADAYTEYIRQSGAEGDGEIDGAAVAGRSLRGAQVLVAASVQVRTADGDRDSEPVQQLRLRVTVVPEDGELKVAGLVLVG